MEPPSEVLFRDRALIVGDVLVIADLHLGKGASGGFELPVGDGADILERCRELISGHSPDTVVVAGDLLHSFSTIPRSVEDTLDGLEAAVAGAGADLVVTPGNHDTMLETVWDGPTPAYYRLDDTIVCHGHQVPEIDAEGADSIERYVIGHDHPTIEVEGERRPCFLLGEGVLAESGTRDDPVRPDLVMLPAFNRLLRGVAVNDMEPGDFQSPLCRSTNALAPVVRDDRAADTLTFPRLGEFRHRL
jgi:putative SbcD/Mre11-related phosphoesterase